MRTKSKEFYYLTPNDHVIRIMAKRKPSASKKRTWTVYEFDGDRWFTPSIPEITWGMLSTLKFIGHVTQSKSGIIE